MGYIHWPSNDEITPETKILLVMFGGAGASSSNYGIETLGKEFDEDVDNEYGQIATAWGYCRVTTRSKKLYKEIKEKRNKIKEKTGSYPMLILVGKSMGGWKLHRTHKRLSDAGINVDLFIGVDICSQTDCHYVENGKLVFRKNVKKLLNFYQVKERGTNMPQCGYAVQLEGEAFTDDININVNEG